MEETEKPTVSIVLLAYNHLDYTKICVENLYRYTADVSFELITVDNGSSDGTKEYFESLPNEKKISFPQNIGVDKAVNSGFRQAEGTYVMNLSNDIVPTSRWLSNLVACMESDPDIGMVVPICNYSSNDQQMNLPYRSQAEIQAFAKGYNKTNPKLWEDRLRLVTYTCLFRGSVVREIGGFDEEFNPGAYDDDAISCRIRRMGYRLILAADTYVHHFGSVTFNDEYCHDNQLAGRNMGLFIRKFGIASNIFSAIDHNIVNLADYRKNETVRILGIGPSSGATLLQIKNVYRQCGNDDVLLMYLSTAPQCLTDLRTICVKVVEASPDDAEHVFPEVKFDLIVVECNVEELLYPEGFFQQIASMTTEHARIIMNLTDEMEFRAEEALNPLSFEKVKQAETCVAFEKGSKKKE